MELALGIIVFLFGLLGLIFCIKGLFESFERCDLVNIIFYNIGTIGIFFFLILTFIKLIEII